MSVSASQIFEFLDRQQSFSVDRYEIAHASFRMLRHCVRSIVRGLNESGDIEALSIANELRVSLFEWLTAPITFDASILDTVRRLGDPEEVSVRWGCEIRSLYDSAQTAAQALMQTENPMRIKARDIIRDLRAVGKTFQIYCSRFTAPYYESLLTPPADLSLDKKIFIHSIKQYRDARLFDVLIKIGPLRSRGWGSTPDAIITSPRFASLFQIVWAGCSDEPGFGYDPAISQGDSSGVQAPPGATNSPAPRASIEWTRKVVQFGSDNGVAQDTLADFDEFRVFSEFSGDREKRRANLVQISEDYGILFPQHSNVLSYDPAEDAQEPLGRRLPGESLLEGMFVVRPHLHDVDLGGLHAEHGHYSRLWKERLLAETKRDVVGLCSRLRKEGLNLVHLEAAVHYWCHPPSTVIHAPQQKKHFEIMIRVLEMDEATAHVSFPSSGVRQQPWWVLAWNEIRKSRGEAIQVGVQGNEIIEEELLELLGRFIDIIRQQADNNDEFIFLIPEGHALRGEVLFNKICLIEEGFIAPENVLKLVQDINIIEQWRA